MIEHDRQQVSAEDAAAVKPVAVEAAAVEAAARVLGVPLAPTMAERIAEGAQAAVTAVAAASRQWDSVGPTAPIGEPADYLGLLESLAPSANALPVVGVTPDPVAPEFGRRAGYQRK